MRELIPIAVAAIIVMAIVLIVARKFRISPRYERAPRELNSWSALDKGIDPTQDHKA